MLRTPSMARHLLAAIALTIAAPARAEDQPADPKLGEQIEVHDTRPDAGSTRMSIEEAREVPGTLGDPVRAVEVMPGVTPMFTSSPYFYLRGAPPANIAYEIDGVRVPVLFHGGVLSSVIAPGLIAALGIYPSAVPARFGGTAGGAVELETRRPAGKPRGEAALKLYEAGGLVETPFARDGSALAAARIGYPALVTQLFDNTSAFSYWDYQSRIAWKLGAHDRIGVFAFGAHDLATSTGGGETHTTFGADVHRVDLRYDHDLGERGRIRVAATGGWSSIGARTRLADKSVAVRAEAELPLTSALTLRGGARFDLDRYTIASATDVDPAASSGATAVPPPTNKTAFAYAEAVWDVSHDLALVVGGRLGRLGSARAGATHATRVAEPTFAARYRIAAAVTSLTSFGIAHQLPSLRVGDIDATAVTVPGFPTSDTRLQRSIAAAQGIEVLLPSAVIATATAFATSVRAESNLPAACVEQFDASGAHVNVCADERPDARTFGLELSVKRALTAHLGGLVSYTLSRTTERFGDGATQRSGFDRRHVLNVLVAHDLGRHWRAGARGRLYSGAPILELDPVNGHPVATASQTSTYFLASIRFERRWELTAGRSVSLVIEVINPTLSRDDTPSSCVHRPGEMCPPPDPGRFFLPSIGLEGTF